MNILHVLGGSKIGQTENTPSCVDSGGEIIEVNSIYDFLLTHGLCSLNTHANVFSLHTLASQKQDKRKKHLHVLITHRFSSEISRAKSIDYFLLTHGPCSLNTPGNPLHTLGVTKTEAENTNT